MLRHVVDDALDDAPNDQFLPVADRDVQVGTDQDAFTGEVDLVEPAGVRNRHYWRGINRSRERLYEA